MHNKKSKAVNIMECPNKTTPNHENTTPEVAKCLAYIRHQLEKAMNALTVEKVEKRVMKAVLNLNPSTQTTPLVNSRKPCLTSTERLH
jgi:hypothetical protein